MTVTSGVFEAYLKCPTKCFLKSLGETDVKKSLRELDTDRERELP